MAVYNIPIPSTPFLGRQDELRQIADLLADPACRLLTLVGPGGMGKTRLALQLAISQAPRYVDGVFFAPLQPLTSPDQIVSAIAEALRLTLFPAGEPKAQLLHFLSDKALLLVLDNLEHLLGSIEMISEILAAAPRVKVLVTSRERLNLMEEWVFDVAGLSFPPSEAETELEGYSAVQLFTHNARRVRPGFGLNGEEPAVVRICRVLEGMPLGIELAASWARTLSCHEIARQLEHGLDILMTPVRNMPERHRSMRAVLDQSWSLLSEDERIVFARLSVFRGGFTLEAAKAAAGATLLILAALVDKSWLRLAPHDERYDIHELLRQYGEDRLRLSDVAWRQTCDRHCAYYAQFLYDRELKLLGAEFNETYRQVKVEIRNERAAWDWAVQGRKIGELQQLLNRLLDFYYMTGWLQEAIQALETAVQMFDTNLQNREEALLLGNILAWEGAFFTYVASGSPEEVIKALEKSLALFQEFEARRESAFTLQKLGEAAFWYSNFSDAKDYIQQALNIYRENDDTWSIANSLAWLGISLLYSGAVDEAQAFFQESSAIFEVLGDPYGKAMNLNGFSHVAFRKGRYEEAKALTEASLAICKQFNILFGILFDTLDLGKITCALGDYAEAGRHFRLTLKMAADFQSLPFGLNTFVEIAVLYSRRNQKERAVELLALALRHPATFRMKVGEGYLEQLKGELPASIFEAAVKRGQSPDVDTTLKAVLADLNEPFPLSESSSEPSPDALTLREIEVLKLLAAGLSNREIANQLILAVGTVKWYISDIFSKLGVKSRTQAVARAREIGLLS